MVCLLMGCTAAVTLLVGRQANTRVAVTLKDKHHDICEKSIDQECNKNLRHELALTWHVIVFQTPHPHSFMVSGQCSSGIGIIGLSVEGVLDLNVG